VFETVKSNTTVLYHKRFSLDTPVRDLNLHLLARYFIKGEHAQTKGALLDSVISCGMNPTTLAFSKPARLRHQRKAEDGVIDPIQHLIFNEKYIKPWSMEYTDMPVD